jgi:glycosyltransferase involved in cell wall biosynthesis
MAGNWRGTTTMNDTSDKEHRVCVLIPAYCEERRIGAVVRGLKERGMEVLVIDDGSSDRTEQAAREAGAEVVRHERNRGKGAALNTGFQWAREHGYEAVITMDADGQHLPEEALKFLDAYKRTGLPVLVGNRMWNPAGMPPVRRWTNRFMSALLGRIMKQYVPDTQCGFRLYRCDVLPVVAGETERFDAESEILLHIATHGIPIGAVRISTVYGDERSKIRPVSDTIRFMKMLLRFWKAQRATRASGAP